MKPSERIKEIRRETITRLNREYREKHSADISDLNLIGLGDKAVEAIEQTNEESPLLWVHAILAYMDELDHAEKMKRPSWAFPD
jgi:hypothetical protein